MAHQPRPHALQGSSVLGKQQVWSWQLPQAGSLKGPCARAPSMDRWHAAVRAVQHAGQTALQLAQTLSGALIP